MSELLAAAAENLGAPEEIVMRSAQARSSADGVSVDDVLQAWAGGAVATATVEAPPAAPAEAPAPEPAPPVEEPVAEPVEAAAPAAVTEPSPPVVIEVLEEPEEPVEVPALSERIKSPAALGAVVGLVLGLLGLLLASPWLIGAATATQDADPAPAFLVSTTAVLSAVAAISIVFGGLTAVLARNLPTYSNPAAKLSTRAWAAFMMGAITGLILGAAAAAILLGGFGETTEITVADATVARTMLQLLPTLGLILLGGAALGTLSAVTPHVIGMPAGLRGEEAETPAKIRRRMSVAYGGPLLILATIGVLVYSLSRVLLEWPQFAPAVASLVALSILGFAGLLRIRPGTRLRRGDVYAAFSGVIVIFIVIVAILATFVGTEEHGTSEGSDIESREVVRLI
ncbi:MAG: hypothetical protein ACE5MI_07415 [Acidimicrobiia bacterium]